MAGAIKLKAEGRRRFGTAANLNDSKAQAAALSEALQSGEKSVFINALSEIARARGMSELARETGTRREVLYVALQENRNPTLGSIFTVLNGLGIALRAEARMSTSAKPVKQ